jgi:hypothetical protein
MKKTKIGAMWKGKTNCSQRKKQGVTPFKTIVKNIEILMLK